MPKHRYLNLDKIAKPVGYTHVVEAAAPRRIIFISGQPGLDLDNRRAPPARPPQAGEGVEKPFVHAN